MQDREYVINGTVKGMNRILTTDFDMEEAEAKLFIYYMLHQASGESANGIDHDELDEWYHVDEDKYEGQILNTHYVLNFTLIKKNLIHTAYIFLVKFFSSRANDLLLIGADLLFLIVTSIAKVTDEDYCVYAHIVKLCMDDSEKLFSEDDIITKYKLGKCDYLDNDWKCPYLYEHDDCTCNREKVHLAFKSLEKMNIIRSVGDFYVLEK